MKSIRIELKWAVIFTVAGLLWMLLERVAGLHNVHIDKHATFTSLFAIPAIAIYIFALLDKRKNFYNGTMTYKQGLISGLIITLVIVMLTPLSQYLTSMIITPGYFPNAIRYAVAEGMMTQEEAERYFSVQSYIVQGMIGAAVMGILTSAVVAIFTRRKNADQRSGTNA